MSAKKSSSMKEKQSFQCELCENVSNTKIGFKKHQISHSSDLQTCTECDKQFSSSKGLILHTARSHKVVDGTEKDLKKSKTIQNQEEEGHEEESIQFAPKETIEHEDVKQKKTKIVKDKKVSKKSKVKLDECKKPLKEVKSKNQEEVLSKPKNCEFSHNIHKASPFDFWEDGEDDFKLLWLEEMGGRCSLACCENSVVRAGLCCDPATLGRCLQPYQAQCYAPCCHHSVQLRENYRWVGGELKEVEKVELINPMEAECQLGNKILEEHIQAKVINDAHDDINDSSESPTPTNDEHCEERYIPQVFSDPSISKYLDSKLGKVIPKSLCEKEFFKFYKDSSLPRGCRIVHKKTVGSVKIDVSYRSSCGRFFRTRDELKSFVANSEKTEDQETKLNFETTKSLELSSKIYAENLYRGTYDHKLKDVEVKNKNLPVKFFDQVVKDTKSIEKKPQKVLVENKEENKIKVVPKSDIELAMNKNPKHHIKSIDEKAPVKKKEENKIKVVPKSENVKAKFDIELAINKKTNHDEQQKPPMLQSVSMRDDSVKGDKRAEDIPRIGSKGKISGCDECGITFPLCDVTLHLVQTHPGMKMNRCKICKSGLMSNQRFEKHNREIHAKKSSKLDKKETLNKSNTGEPTGKPGVSSEKASTISGPGNNVPFGNNSPKDFPVSENDEVNSRATDLNDSVETMDKIKEFINTSTKSPMRKSNRKNEKSTQEKFVDKPSPSLPRSVSSTPLPSKAKKVGVKESKSEKRKSVSSTPVASKKKLRKSSSGSFTEVLVKDTDPKHPTSSLNLRLKGRNLKVGKKLSPIDAIMKRNRILLDPKTVINDCVDGELCVVQTVRPDHYYRVSGDVDVRQARRRKGRLSQGGNTFSHPTTGRK